MSRAVGLALVVFVSTLSGGCDKVMREVVSSAATDPVAEPAHTPASEAQAQAFNTALLDGVERGDVAAIAALLDWDTLVRRGAAGLVAPEAVLTSASASAEKSAVERGLPAQLGGTKAAGGRLTLLGPQTLDGKVWQTFRLIHGAGGFDHISFLLSAPAQGPARAVDVHTLTQGEHTSQTLRRVLLPMLATDAKSMLTRVTGGDAAMLEGMKSVIGVQQLAAQGKAKEALAAYAKLPASLRKERWAMIMRVSIASQADEPTYLSTLDELRHAFPDDPTIAVYAIDGEALRGRPDGALRAIDTVEKGAMPDAYFDVARANVLVTADRLAEARAAAERAIARDATLIEAHWVLVSVSLRARDFAETSKRLLQIRDTFQLAIAPEQVPDYAEYVKSPEYAAVKSRLNP